MLATAIKTIQFWMDVVGVAVTPLRLMEQKMESQLAQLQLMGMK